MSMTAHLKSPPQLFEQSARITLLISGQSSEVEGQEGRLADQVGHNAKASDQNTAPEFAG